MKKKKTTTPVAEAKPAQLSKEDLLRCELASAKTEAALSATGAQKLRLERVRADCAAKIDSAEQQLQALQLHTNDCIRKAELLWAEMGERYGVDFKRASYDTETGIIHELPDETKGASTEK